MMRRALYLLIGSVVLSATAYAQTLNTGTGTRIDFLDQNGERIASKTASRSTYMTYLFQTTYLQDYGNFSISFDGKEEEEPYSIKMVPWGTESYPMEVETPQEDVKVSYEIVGESDNKRTRAGDENVLCGMTIRFAIEVPDGEYPVVTIFNKYTDFDDFGEEVGAFSPKGLANAYYLHGYDATDYNKRQSVYEQMTSTAPFVRDSNNPSLWYVTMTMPNEPVAYSFESEKADGEMLKKVITGIMRSLYCQYLGRQGMNGEPLLQMGHGDCLSGDFINSNYGIFSKTGFTSLKNTSSNNYVMHIGAWYIPFTYITDANLLLELLDNFNFATEDEKNEARAQLLTLRSHGYWRLLQLYGKRWKESDGGNVLCAPLETFLNLSPQPLSSMKDIIAQCYKDLDWAINYLPTNHEEIMVPDVNVAYGVKMRIAMLCEDWKIVKEMSEKILANKPLTTNEGLLAGFFRPEESWIWGAWNCDNPDEDLRRDRLYYYGFHAYMACNGSTSAIRSYGANAIDKDLFSQIEENDVRHSFYVMPGCVSTDWMAPTENWYSSTYFRIYNSVCILKYPNEIRQAFESRKPFDVFYAPFNCGGYPGSILFGSQTKFMNSGKDGDVHGINAVVFMRSDEALLANAEANFRLGNEEECRRQLKVLNGMRQEGYDVTATGEELFEEICRTYKIELWGEGHSWYNDKRWGKAIIRHRWVEGDINSGNWFVQDDNTLMPQDANGWRMLVPQTALETNPYIDLNAMGYDSATTANFAAPRRNTKTVNSNLLNNETVIITTDAAEGQQADSILK